VDTERAYLELTVRHLKVHLFTIFQMFALLILRVPNMQGKMADPEVLSNNSEMQRIAKAASDLEPTVQAYREYLEATEALEEAKQLLRESDGRFPPPLGKAHSSCHLKRITKC
jgi:PCRF domain